MRHGTTRRTHVWTPEADEDLLDAIKIYGTNNWLIGRLRLSSSLMCFSNMAFQSQELYLQMPQPNNVKTASKEVSIPN